MNRETRKAAFWGLIVTVALAAMIWVGSRNLSHFDAALVGYTFAVLFAAFAITYRYAMWLQRPPTALYWKRGWQVFFKPRYLAHNMRVWFARLTREFALNLFIFRRSLLRGGAHFLIMWGCIIAIAITFPLVFGWIHFETLPDDLNWYRAYLFGFPTFSFPIHSLFGFIVFHGLVWASFLVIAGVMLAMRRRMRDHGAAALQQFGEDFFPLILLFAVSVTGLMLTASYSWLKGYAFDFLAILHAITVIFTLLWLPFGKFFHIFQRPAQLGVSFYKDIGEREERAACRRCGAEFTSRLKVEDLIRVEKQLGYSYEIKGSAEHYQWICPRCRRAMLVIAQGRAWLPRRGELIQTDAVTLPQPSFGNPQQGFGPLGEEDRKNFHP
ncbi:MAG TPA: MFS transporter [Blastocatellia bacterium]|nr:MFS transporter [Blastocatellia bacterium]